MKQTTIILTILIIILIVSLGFWIHYSIKANKECEDYCNKNNMEWFESSSLAKCGCVINSEIKYFKL